jgi:hypothetical protein
MKSSIGMMGAGSIKAPLLNNGKRLTDWMVKLKADMAQAGIEVKEKLTEWLIFYSQNREKKIQKYFLSLHQHLRRGGLLPQKKRDPLGLRKIGQGHQKDSDQKMGRIDLSNSFLRNMFLQELNSSLKERPKKIFDTVFQIFRLTGRRLQSGESSEMPVSGGIIEEFRKERLHKGGAGEISLRDILADPEEIEHHLIQDRLVERRLILIMIMDERLVDPRFLGDLLSPSPGKTAKGKLLFCRAEDMFLGGL